MGDGTRGLSTLFRRINFHWILLCRILLCNRVERLPCRRTHRIDLVLGCRALEGLDDVVPSDPREREGGREARPAPRLACQDDEQPLLRCRSPEGPQQIEAVRAHRLLALRAQLRHARLDRGKSRGGRTGGTQREAEAIKRVFPDAAVYTRDAASEETIKSEAGKYRYVHLATHGFLNDAAPLLSSLVVAKPGPGSSEDGFLTAREVYDFRLNADLVVLSACNSGRGEARTGEGLVGLTWAFFVAGAPSQVVSQWSVDDAATSQLMGQLYANLKAGMLRGEALRRASLTLMHSPGRHCAHPYFWAPFILVGDWR